MEDEGFILVSQMEDEGTHNNVPTWSYDVFLCFRGEDTRYTFTGNLFNALCKKKINVFMDHDGLMSGYEVNFILEALQKSRIAIVVFSKDFASSTYCLDEVVKISENKNKDDFKALPIFYEVDPSDVYCMIPNNKTALTELRREKYPNNPEKVEEWMSALSSVASSSHYQEWQLKDGGYKYEYERIDKIVEWVTSNTLPRGDVFLSFLEKDTRDSFVDFLSDALEKERFKIHMHDEKSEELLDQISPSCAETIDGSWLSIVILSENYAYSPLCLNELVKILDCMKNKKKELIVLPIFYKVEASDIRHRIYSFGDAMTEHETKVEKNPEKVQKWRSALAEVANLKGYHLKSGYEFETIENIVKEALNAFYQLREKTSA